ncbi:hypothetical protein CYMTET_35595 [Cymbomonas tetramitiformis]|uniref:Uncharacterized protein n=1 Tax=Cymbomonas tetramitiformis TaxID=36881 RepID=A0AAE0KNL8_9CHLO|nr:hypothetical protein CYMTET_35595 [Cymbomonas tetramitiformis]|eukprot:gene4-4_t
MSSLNNNNDAAAAQPGDVEMTSSGAPPHTDPQLPPADEAAQEENNPGGGVASASDESSGDGDSTSDDEDEDSEEDGSSSGEDSEEDGEEQPGEEGEEDEQPGEEGEPPFGLQTNAGFDHSTQVVQAFAGSTLQTFTRSSTNTGEALVLRSSIGTEVPGESAPVLDERVCLALAFFRQFGSKLREQISRTPKEEHATLMANHLQTILAEHVKHFSGREFLAATTDDLPLDTHSISKMTTMFLAYLHSRVYDLGSVCPNFVDKTGTICAFTPSQLVHMITILYRTLSTDACAERVSEELDISKFVSDLNTKEAITQLAQQAPESSSSSNRRLKRPSFKQTIKTVQDNKATIRPKVLTHGGSENSIAFVILNATSGSGKMFMINEVMHTLLHTHCFDGIKRTAHMWSKFNQNVCAGFSVCSNTHSAQHTNAQVQRVCVVAVYSGRPVIEAWMRAIHQRKTLYPDAQVESFHFEPGTEEEARVLIQGVSHDSTTNNSVGLIIVCAGQHLAQVTLLLQAQPHVATIIDDPYDLGLFSGINFNCRLTLVSSANFGDLYTEAVQDNRHLDPRFFPQPSANLPAITFENAAAHFFDSSQKITPLAFRDMLLRHAWFKTVTTLSPFVRKLMERDDDISIHLPQHITKVFLCNAEERLNIGGAPVPIEIQACPKQQSVPAVKDNPVPDICVSQQVPEPSKPGKKRAAVAAPEEEGPGKKSRTRAVRPDASVVCSNAALDLVGSVYQYTKKTPDNPKGTISAATKTFTRGLQNGAAPKCSACGYSHTPEDVHFAFQFLLTPGGPADLTICVCCAQVFDRSNKSHSVKANKAKPVTTEELFCPKEPQALQEVLKAGRSSGEDVIPVFRSLYNLLRDVPSERIILYTSDRRRPTLLLLLLTLQRHNPDRFRFRELTPSSAPVTEHRKLKHGYFAADTGDSLLWKSVTRMQSEEGTEPPTDDTLEWFNRQEDATFDGTKFLVLSTEQGNTELRGLDTYHVDGTVFFSLPNESEIKQAAGRGVRMSPEPKESHFIVYLDGNEQRRR